MILAGAMVLERALTNWESQEPVRFAVYLLFGCLAGALKVRLPGMTGTYSLTFLFIVVGIFELSFSETVVIACASMMVQTGVRTATKPSLIRIAFNAGACSLAAAGAYEAARWATWGTVAVPFVLAAISYFAVNTSLVSIILAHQGQMRFTKILGNWFRLSAAFYATGLGIAGLLILMNYYFGWLSSLLVFPMIYLEYLFFSLKIADQAPVRGE